MLLLKVWVLFGETDKVTNDWTIAQLTIQCHSCDILIFKK